MTSYNKLLEQFSYENTMLTNLFRLKRLRIGKVAIDEDATSEGEPSSFRHCFLAGNNLSTTTMLMLYNLWCKHLLHSSLTFLIERPLWWV